MMKSKKVLAGDSENEFDVDEPEEVGDHSEDEWDPTAFAKTPARIKKESKVSLLTKKDRGSKAKPPPPAPISSSSRGRGIPTKVLKVEPKEYSEDEEEFEEEGDEEEVGDDSEDEWAPTAVAKTLGKRLRSAKSTPARKKKEPTISYDEDEEEKPSKKERGSKTKPTPPAPIPSSSRGRRRATKVLKVEPKEYSEDEEEFEEEGDEEEVGDDSEDEWAPTAVAKTPARIKKESKVSLLTKKDRGSKAKPPPPAPISSSSRGRGIPTKVLKVEPKEYSEDDEEFEEEGDEEEVGDDSEDEWAPTAVAKTPARIKKESRVSLLTKKDRGSKAKPPPPAPIPSSSRGRGIATKVLKVQPEEEQEELKQGLNAKPAQKFTAGAFVVCKTDMIDGANPYIWKIVCEEILKRYIPFELDGKVLYKSEKSYRPWGSGFKDQYYSAPVSFIKHTNKEHIIEFYKDKIKTDPIV